MTPCRATARDIKSIVNSCCLHFDSFVSSPYTIHVFTIYLLLHLLLCCWNIGFITELVVYCHTSCRQQLKRYLSIAIDFTNYCEMCFALFSFLRILSQSTPMIKTVLFPSYTVINVGLCYHYQYPRGRVSETCLDMSILIISWKTLHGYRLYTNPGNTASH